jgi:hypothetical protein
VAADGSKQEPADPTDPARSDDQEVSGLEIVFDNLGRWTVQHLDRGCDARGATPQAYSLVEQPLSVLLQILGFGQPHRFGETHISRPSR